MGFKSRNVFDDLLFPGAAFTKGNPVSPCFFLPPDFKRQVLGGPIFPLFNPYFLSIS